jgi:glycoside/pentoside/hexuronide:cation symporter, GPH family
MNQPTRHLSIPVMCAYGTGDIAQAIKNQGFNILLLFYYQQIVGLPGTLTGLALGIALFFDAITDPIAGGLSDRLKGRFGRRHPMIAIAGIPLAISFVFLFSPPENVSDFLGFLWLTTFAILVRGAMTFYHIPHLALGAEMAHDYHQRSTLFAFNTFIGAMGGAIAAILIYRVFFPTTPEYSPGLLNPAGYQQFAMAAGIAMIIALAICVLGTAKEIPHLRDAQTTARFSLANLYADMKAVFADRDFFMVFAGSILVSLVGSIEAVGQPYMGVHFWGLKTEQLAYVAVVALVAFPLSFALVPLITRIFDKKLTLIISGLIAIITPNIIICLRLLELPWFPENDSSWVLVIYLGSVFISASMLPIIGATYNSIYADLADAHELRTGKRREGALYSTRAFANKATGALGLVIGGGIIDIIAFPENATYGTVPADIIWNLGLFVGPATSVFTLMGVVFFFFYRIDRARHAEITRQIELRRTEQAPDQG